MTAPRRTTRQVLLALAVPLLAWLAIACWSFSAPVGSSPDDDFHLPSIWCGLGDRPGLCEPVDDGPTRLVPNPLLTSPCYAFKPDADASCWNPSTTELSVAPRANVDGLYPPLFYTAMSVFASPDVQTSVLVIRLVNTTIAVVLLTAVFWVLPRKLRPALVISTVATSVPLGLFLIGSTNPSSWAILSAAIVWICVYGTTQVEGRRRTALAGLALLGALIGAGARADAAVFAVYGAAVGLALGLGSLRARSDVRRQAVPLITSLAIAVGSVAFYLSASQGGAAWGGMDPSTRPLTVAQHISNLFEIPSLWIGALGQEKLGWMDTTMPAAVWVPTTMVFAGAIFIGIRAASGRRTIVLVGALVALWAVPFILLAQSNALVGTTVQPRYLLPLLIIAVGVASVRTDPEAAWDRLRYGLASACLVVAVTISLHQNIVRYTRGAGNESVDPGADAAWWWVGVPSPLVVWITGAVAFAGMLAVLWYVKERPTAVRSPQSVVG